MVLRERYPLPHLVVVGSDGSAVCEWSCYMSQLRRHLIDQEARRPAGLASAALEHLKRMHPRLQCIVESDCVERRVMLGWHLCRAKLARMTFFVESRIFLPKMLRNSPRKFWAFMLWVLQYSLQISPQKKQEKFTDELLQACMDAALCELSHVRPS